MPEWLDVTVKIVQLVLTGLLGVAAWKIATRQADTAHAKLRLDLYERRYAVYTAFVEFIDQLQTRSLPDEEYTALVRKLDPAQFLFGNDINDWKCQILPAARKFNNAKRIAKRPQGFDAVEYSQEELLDASKTFKELSHYFDRECQRVGDIFKPYLDFSKNL